jgi:translation initiation factor 4A
VKDVEKDSKTDAPEKSAQEKDGKDKEPYEVQAVASFDEMGLQDELLRGIYAYGFEKPSAIQQRGLFCLVFFFL